MFGFVPTRLGDSHVVIVTPVVLLRKRVSNYPDSVRRYLLLKRCLRKKKNKRVVELNYDYTIIEMSDVFVAKAKDLETGEVKKVFRLNETGVIILEALQAGSDIDEIARRLTDGFDVDFETAKSEASAFIAKLNL